MSRFSFRLSVCLCIHLQNTGRTAGRSRKGSGQKQWLIFHKSSLFWTLIFGLCIKCQRITFDEKGDDDDDDDDNVMMMMMIETKMTTIDKRASEIIFRNRFVSGKKLENERLNAYWCWYFLIHVGFGLSYSFHRTPWAHFIKKKPKNLKILRHCHVS